MNNELVPLRDNRVGEELDVSRSTVYNLINSGDLVRVNIGARSFVTRRSIDAYIERLTTKATA